MGHGEKRALVTLVISSLLVLSGCAATTGTQVTDVSFVHKGKTQRAELISKLGAPTSSSRDSSGKETLVWMHTKTKVDGKTYIPFAGLVMGGSSTEMTEFAVTLDRNGVVQDYATTSSEMESRLGR